MNYPVDYFTGTGTTTTFTLSQFPASASSIIVTVNGVKSVSSPSNPGYLVNGNQLVFPTPPASSASIEVTYLGVLSQVNVPADQSITQNMLSLQVSNTILYQTTANGSQNTFTLQAPPVSANSLIVSANGVIQYDYYINGSTLYLNFTPPNGTLIRAQALALAQASVPSDGSVTSNKLGSNLTLTGTTTATGNVNVFGKTTLTYTSTTSSGDGSIHLNGTTNRIDFNTNGVNPPTAGAISTGTKLVLYPQNSSTTVDYALGIQNSTLWSSIPSSAQQFLWYANTTPIMTLSGTGNLGIGTTAGTYGQFEVTGSGYVASNVRSNDASGVNAVLVANSSNECRLNVISNHPLAIYTNNTERMRIFASGGVSIGNTTDPGATNLSVTGTITATSYTGAWAYLPAGTAMVFQQTTAPTGWTKVTTNNDCVLRVVSGTVGTGGTVAFSTAFNATNSVDGTAITTAQMPVHNHGITDPGHAHAINAYTSGTEAGGYGLANSAGFQNRPLVSTTGGQGTTGVGTGISINNAGSGSTHSHTLANLAVKYVDVIIATKN